MNALAYIEALAITQVMEAPVYCVALTTLADVPTRSALLASIIVNFISHPLLTFVFLPTADRLVQPLPAIVVAEAAVCALEAALLLVWLRRHTAVIIGASLIANGISFAAGLLVFSLLRGAT